MKLLWLLLVLLPISTFSSEFKDLESYRKIYRSENLNGQNGHWLKVDRIKQTDTWAKANLVNLSRENGYIEYETIQQRYAFLKWLKVHASQNQSDVKWPAAAVTITSYLKNICGPFAFGVGCASTEIRHFASEGNAMVFKTLWKDFTKIIVDNPTAEQAMQLDFNLLEKEQQAIQPFFQNLSKSSLRKLQRLVQKDNVISSYLPGLEFQGNLLSEQNRYFHGLRMMGYRH